MHCSCLQADAVSALVHLANNTESATSREMLSRYLLDIVTHLEMIWLNILWF